MKRLIKYSEDKVQGVLFGTFIGDAIGAAFEGRSPDDIPPLDFNYVIENPARMYTDDTQMTISVFEEMIENGDIERYSLIQRFLWRFAPWRRYGGGMLNVIEKWRDGQDLDAAASSVYNREGNFGNGAAIRVAPISAFFQIDEAEELDKSVRLCSSVTHTHPYGISGALLQAHVVLLALNDTPIEEWLDHIFSLSIESAYKIKFENVISCLERSASPHESARVIGNSAIALHSVPAAIYAVMRNPDSFCDTVLFAIAMGGDTDSIGAMAGAISGALSGMNDIPSQWVQNLENDREGRDFIRDLVKKSFERMDD